MYHIRIGNCSCEQCEIDGYALYAMVEVDGFVEFYVRIGIEITAPQSNEVKASR